MNGRELHSSLRAHGLQAARTLSRFHLCAIRSLTAMQPQPGSRAIPLFMPVRVVRHPKAQPIS